MRIVLVSRLQNSPIIIHFAIETVIFPAQLFFFRPGWPESLPLLCPDGDLSPFRQKGKKPQIVSLLMVIFRVH